MPNVVCPNCDARTSIFEGQRAWQCKKCGWETGAPGPIAAGARAATNQRFCSSCGQKVNVDPTWRAFKCLSCGATTQIAPTTVAASSAAPRGRVARKGARKKMKPSEVGSFIALVAGIVVGVLSQVYLHLTELWGPLPWIIGAFAAGSFYEGYIKIAAYQNMADRK